jgi:ABC-type lipoprotein release transport system permease subunit
MRLSGKGPRSGNDRGYRVACAVMMVVAFGASAGPAWRAARLEPVEALREE